jgi:nucleotide-binding universal stress UspA family protein
MLRIQNVLLPVDYSKRSLDAADWVRLLGSLSPVKVTVLHVTDERAQRRADEDVIRAFSDRLAGFDVGFSEVPGDPAGQIIEYARSHPTDLIVMPTRGRGSLSRLLQGSTTVQVLRGTACPVWTGVAREQALPKPARIIKAACLVDLGPQSANVLRWASAFADSHGARLAVVHASPQLVPIAGMVHDPEWRLHVANMLRTQLAELTADTGVEAEIMLAPGEPAAAVAAAAETCGADVLVIGRARRGLSRRLRSNAYGIIRQSPCAVISIDPTAYDVDAPPRRRAVPHEGLERELALASAGSASAGVDAEAKAIPDFSLMTAGAVFFTAVRSHRG